MRSFYIIIAAKGTHRVDEFNSKNNCLEELNV